MCAAISWLRTSNSRHFGAPHPLKTWSGRFGRTSAFMSRVTALPPAASPLTAPEAQLPTTTAASSAPASFRTGLPRANVCFYGLDPAERRGSSAAGRRPQRRRSRDRRRSRSSLRRKFRVCRSSRSLRSTAALEFALGRACREPRRRRSSDGANAATRARIPACPPSGPERVAPAVVHRRYSWRAEPIEHDDAGTKCRDLHDVRGDRPGRRPQVAWTTVPNGPADPESTPFHRPTRRSRAT